MAGGQPCKCIDGATGKRGISWRGDFDIDATYKITDGVFYQGASYISISETHHTGQLPTDTAFWDLIAAGGDSAEAAAEALASATAAAVSAVSADASEAAALSSEVAAGAFADEAAAAALEAGKALVDNVTALRALAQAPTDGARYATRGHTSFGIGAADYDWDDDDTTADDGALTIKITAVATGRFKYRDTNNGIFPVLASTIDHTGSSAITTDMVSLITKLQTQGYRGIDGGGNKYKLAPGEGFVVPPRAEGVGFKLRGFKFDGSESLNGPFGPWLYFNVAIAGKVGALINAYDGVHSWSGAVVAGQDTFVGVEQIDGAVEGEPGLAEGATVMVAVGADTTNIGGADIQFFAKIKQLTPTAGTTCTVKIDRVVPRTPPTCDGALHSVPSWNENINRTSARHDMFVVTGFQDNLEFEDCTFDHCYPLPAGARNVRFTNTMVNETYFGFRMDVCEGVLFNGLTLNNLKGGFSAEGYSDNYGFLFTNYGSRGIEIKNLIARNIEASGFYDEELTSGGGAHLTGNTLLNFSNKTDGGVHTGFGIGVRLTQKIIVDDAVITGNGNVVNGDLGGRYSGVQFKRLDVQSAMGFTTNIAEVGSLRWLGEEWSTPKTIQLPLRGCVPSETRDFPVPLRNGTLRSLRLYASTLTGIDDVLLVRGDTGTASIKSFLTEVGAGTWAEVDTFITTMGFSNEFAGSCVAIRVVTDGTFPAGGFLLADMEKLTASRRNDSGAFVNASLPQKIAGVGPPGASAQFVGQEYGDVSLGWIYTAKSVGSGAADWSPTPQAHSANLDGSTAAGGALLKAADAPAQRTALGLGTLATQNGTFSGTSSGSNTGDQSISAIGVSGALTDGTGTLGVAHGGTGAITEALARAALGLAIGTDVQAHSAELDTLAGVTSTAEGRSVLAIADVAALTALLNAATQALKGLMSAADKTIIDTGWRKIEGTITVANFAPGTYSTATFAPGLYKELRLVLRQLATTGGSNIDAIQMAGLTGAYDSRQLYDGGGTPGSFGGAKIIMFSSAIATADITLDLPPAPYMKTVKGILSNTAASTISVLAGKNDDTTHEVTGLEFIIAGAGDVTFSYELYGLPT